MSDETQQQDLELTPGEPVDAESFYESSQALPPPTPLTTWEVIQKCIKILLIFGGIGLLMSFRTVAQHTLPHILIMDGTFEFQEVKNALPIPHLVAWNRGFIQWMLRADRLDGGVLLFAVLGSLSLLLFQSIKLLNPTFRFFSIGKISLQNAQIGTSTLVLNKTVVVKLVQLAVRTLLPACTIWFLCTRFEMKQPVLSYLLRWLGVGVTFWVGFHREGMAGDFLQPEFQSIEESAHRLLLKGALFGAGAFFLQYYAIVLPSDEQMNLYHAFGTFHKGFWSQITTPYLLGGAGMMTSVGLLLFIGGGHRLRPTHWVMLSTLPVIVIALLVNAKHIQKSTIVFAQQHDITQATLEAIAAPYNPDKPLPAAGVPDGIQAGDELLRLLNIPRPTRGSNPLLFFFERDTGIAMQEHYTEDGLPTDAGTERAVLDFLQKRNYQTALSWIAFKHLFNIGAVNFDITTSMRYCIESLAKYPHVAQTMPVLRAMLFYCSASKANIAILDSLADETQFACEDRPSFKMMGDLYLRVGEVEKALTWYRKADMPKTFLERIQKVKPMFREGRVTGTLTLNGKPLVGVKVGVHPMRLNGLPREMEMELLHSGEEMMGGFFQSPRFPRFHPRPYAFRWVSAGATTNAKGEFQLENLTEGQYQMLFALPSEVSLNVPVDKKLDIKNVPGLLYLGYNTPQRALGVIAVTAPVRPNQLKWERVAPAKPEPIKEP